jgi:hypothetical protein
MLCVCVYMYLYKQAAVGLLCVFHAASVSQLISGRQRDLKNAVAAAGSSWCAQE